MNTYSKTALAAAICTALSAGHVGAATFSVTNTDDAGAGSLRDALSQARLNAEADIIDLSEVSGQTISLTSRQLEIDDDDVTVNGAGVTLDAGGNSRVLASYFSDVTLNDLTITGGTAGMLLSLRGRSGAGGGIYAVDSNLELSDCEVSGNSARDGGGVFIGNYRESGGLNLNDSVVSGNTAFDIGGGVYAEGKYGDVTFTGTEVSSNTAGSAGGGLAVYSYGGTVSLVDSVISDNSVTGDGVRTRAFAVGHEALNSVREAQRDGSQWQNRGEVNGGPTGYAGGAGIYSLYGDIEIVRSTISGNSAGYSGGIVAYGDQGSILVDSSTISGNSATGGGAGALRAKYDLQIRNSTISGNFAENNGGLAIYSELYSGEFAGDSEEPRGRPPRTLLIEFTTITDNSADEIGGLGLSSDIAFVINSSVIGGNSATIDPDIGFDPNSFAESDIGFSLVGADSSSGTLNLDTISTSLLGQDPLLGPLADNGGPTFTHLPQDGSPLIDAIPPGTVGCGDIVVDDQGGQDRPVEGGCDIGSVERGTPTPPPPAVAVPVMDRLGLLLMAGLLGLAGLFGFRRRASKNV